MKNIGKNLTLIGFGAIAGAIGMFTALGKSAAMVTEKHLNDPERTVDTDKMTFVSFKGDPKENNISLGIYLNKEKL